MKLVFDLSRVSENKTGIENYYYELTKSYLNLDSKNEIILISNKADYLQEFPDKFKKIVIKSEKPNFIWMIRVSIKLRLIRTDLFLSQSNFMFSTLFGKTIQVVYDLGPFIFPEYYEKDFIKKFKNQFKRASKSAKALVTISNTTRKDVVRLFPNAEDKTINIGSGLNSWITNKPKIKFGDVQERFKLGDKYILSVGTIQPRKNYINMIRAFAQFKKLNKDYKYVIVGQKGWLFEQIYAEVESLELEDSIVFTGFASEEELVLLYQNAKVFLNCSFFEGFGLPLVEAYFMEIPIVASSITIFKEVMQDQATYVNPNKPDEIADGLTDAVKIKPSIDKEFIEQYDWKNVAKSLKEVFELSY